MQFHTCTWLISLLGEADCSLVIVSSEGGVSFLLLWCARDAGWNLIPRLRRYFEPKPGAPRIFDIKYFCETNWLTASWKVVTHENQTRNSAEEN